jgi:DNA-dependent RNA polymerase auxiliary subunit epsilon
MKIEVSNGEIVDKLTIIEIKLENIKNEQKLANLKVEYEILNKAVGLIIDKTHPLYLELLEINKKLWTIEDRIRELEKNKDFNAEFIEVARSVYFTNDKRSDVKRKINDLTNSALVEEKSYEDYN